MWDARDMSHQRARSGFTLLEMLIVVALIAILVSVAIPTFNKQAEISRETADLANVRSAYAEVMYAAMSDDEHAEYHGAAIKQGDGTFRAIVDPLVQTVDGWTMNVSNLAIGSVPSADWGGTPAANGSCTIAYDPFWDKTSIDWRGYSGMTLMELHKVDNEARIAEDQKTLKALGKAILAKGWTRAELMANLGIMDGGSALRIADYYQLKTGSFDSTYESAGFKITANASGELYRILAANGYQGGNVLSSGASTDPKLRNAQDTTYERSLFFSDQLATNQYGSGSGTYNINATKRSIILENIRTDSSGRIISFNSYTKAMDGQADMSAADKNKFKFAIS